MEELRRSDEEVYAFRLKFTFCLHFLAGGRYQTVLSSMPDALPLSKYAVTTVPSRPGIPTVWCFLKSLPTCPRKKAWSKRGQRVGERQDRLVAGDGKACHVAEIRALLGGDHASAVGRGNVGIDRRVIDRFFT